MINIISFQIPPFAWYTYFLILGIIWQQNIIFNQYLFLALLVTGIILKVFLSKQKTNYKRLFYFITCSSLFFLIGVIRTYNIFSKYKKVTKITKNYNNDYKCEVLDITKSNILYYKTCITLNIFSIQTKTNKEASINFKLKIYLPYTPKINVGDFLQIYNLSIKEIKKKNFKLYLIKENIYSSIFLKKFNYKILSKCNESYLRFTKNFIHQKKNILSKKITKKMNTETSYLFKSIFLGLKEKNNENLKDYISRWGLLHYLARSGLHLLLIIFLWSLILRLIPINFFLKQFFIVVIITFYSILTWQSISFCRAILMFFLYKLCIFQNLPINTTHLISLTCLIILIYNPIQIFFLDFQLSFALTFALALYSDIYFRKNILQNKNH